MMKSSDFGMEDKQETVSEFQLHLSYLYKEWTCLYYTVVVRDQGAKIKLMLQ